MGPRQAHCNNKKNSTHVLVVSDLGVPVNKTCHTQQEVHFVDFMKRSCLRKLINWKIAWHLAKVKYMGKTVSVPPMKRVYRGGVLWIYQKSSQIFLFLEFSSFSVLWFCLCADIPRWDLASTFRAKRNSSISQLRRLQVWFFIIER